MLNRIKFRSLLLIPVLALTILIPGAFAGQACYSISNFAVPNYVNITLNGTFFMVRLNFIGPNSAGITINDSRGYTLPLNQPQVIMNSTDYTYSSELINVSWLPVAHTVTVTLCSTPNFLVPSTSATSTVPATTSVASTTASTLATTTVMPTTTTLPSGGSLTLPSGSDTELEGGIVVVLAIISAALCLLYRSNRKKKGSSRE